MGNYNSHEAMD